MTLLFKAVVFAFTASIAYIYSISDLVEFTPQAFALGCIVFIFTYLRTKKINLFLASFLVTLLVFSTGGLNSPLFFLIYFLLFTVAFQNPPSITLSFSLIIIILLANSLNSHQSLLPLASLLFVTPMAWFIGEEQIKNAKLDTAISQEETDIFLWLSLKLKRSLIHILDSVSLLHSNPRLGHSDKQELAKIKEEIKYLINSADKLKDAIDKESDTI